MHLFLSDSTSFFWRTVSLFSCVWRSLIFLTFIVSLWFCFLHSSLTVSEVKNMLILVVSLIFLIFQCALTFKRFFSWAACSLISVKNLLTLLVSIFTSQSMIGLCFFFKRWLRISFIWTTVQKVWEMSEDKAAKEEVLSWASEMQSRMRMRL